MEMARKWAMRKAFVCRGTTRVRALFAVRLAPTASPADESAEPTSGFPADVRRHAPLVALKGERLP
jgi:hypothetical protein